MPECNWISTAMRMPENMQRVLVCFKIEDKPVVSICDYIAAKSVLEEDYTNPSQSEDHYDYDEEDDCYWMPEGFYESLHLPEINYFLTEKVLFWMPIAPLTPEGP